MPGVDRQFQLNELVAGQGGFTPLLFAVRDGFVESATALLDAGADINQVAESDKNSPLLMALVNGHFDLARLLHRARRRTSNWAADNGVTPLYAALNVQWAPKALYPQPQAYLQQKLTYLDVMKVLLDKGADVNARLRKKVWYSGYSFDLVGRGRDRRHPVLARRLRQRRRGDEAAGVLRRRPEHPDHEARRPPAHWAMANSASRRKSRRCRRCRSAVPAVTPLQAAAGVGYGEGFAANAHRFAPTGMLAAVKYLVEEHGADVNAVDHEGKTALHHAASRGDNEMIKYLVSKGAEREGASIARARPRWTWPTARSSACSRIPRRSSCSRSLGAMNNHKCVSC